jgi:hypothetical protein
MESLLVDYKRRIASRFVPLEGEAALQMLPESEQFIWSEKIDGHLGFAVVEGGAVRFFNRSGVALDLPDLAPHVPAVDGVWAGEMYVPQAQGGGRARAFHVSTAVANGGAGLCFAVFDAVHALAQPIPERVALVEAAMPAGDGARRVHCVAWNRCESRKDVAARYQEAIAAGKEGLIAIPAHGMGYKLKPMVELDVTVIGYCLKEDGSGIRSLLIGVQNEQGHWQVVASVGGGFDEAARVAWMNRLEGLVADGDIVLVAKNRLAYKWVRPEIVIQIKCIEAIAEDANGPIHKDVLRHEDGTWRGHGKAPGVSLVSPVFQLERTDKRPCLDDTGIRQITDRVDIDAAPAETPGAEADAAPRPQVLFRKVYTKSGKGGMAVRKFVGVKTHREADGQFPAYYVLFTDFSAGRKEPLKTDITLAADADALQGALEMLEEENIKKGWALAAPAA